MMQNDIANP